MHDGAHTHHDHHQPVLWIAVAIGLLLALGSGAVATAIATLVRVLLLTVLAILGLTAIGIVLWLIATRDPASPYRRHRRGQVRSGQTTRLVIPVPEPPEITSLRAELTTVRQELAALQAREIHAIGGSTDYPAVAARRRHGDA